MRWLRLPCPGYPPTFLLLSPDSGSDSRPWLTRGAGPPLSKRELYGWYAYDWANSVYSGVAVSLFVPVILQVPGRHSQNHGRASVT